MVLKSSDDFSSEIKAIKEINSAISDLLSSKENFYKIVRELIVEYYNPIRKRFQDIDYDHRARNFLKRHLEYEQGGEVGEKPEGFLNTNSIYGFLDYQNWYSTEINKLYNFNIVFDCNLSRLKLRLNGSFDGFNNFQLCSFIASGNNLSLKTKNSGSYVLEYVICDDDELEEKIDLLVQSLNFHNFKKKIGKSFENVYFKDYKKLIFKYPLDQDFRGVPLMFYSEEYQKEVFVILEDKISSHFVKSLLTSNDTKEEIDILGVINSLFSGNEPYDNFLSENVAARKFISQSEFFKGSEPSREEIVNFCKDIYYNSQKVKGYSTLNGTAIAKCFVYLFKSECLSIEDILIESDIEKLINTIIFQESDKYFADPTGLVNYGLRQMSSGKVLQKSYENIVNSSEALLFLLKNKEKIQAALRSEKHEHSMFKSPIFTIHPGIKRGLSNMSISVFEVVDKFKGLTDFLKKEGIFDKTKVRIYLKEEECKCYENIAYGINKSFYVVKKMLGSELEVDIEIYLTDNVYKTYISDIFTEEEIEKMSIFKFKDDYDFKYPKDRDVSEFSLRKFLYSNTHELSWISEILK